MNPLDELNLCINRVQAQVQTMDILIKQTQTAVDTAIAWYEQQLQEVDEL